MVRSGETFEAQLRDQQLRTLETILAVTQAAAQDVFEDAQTPVGEGGRMRVDTGFLRNSLTTSLNGGGHMSGVSSYALVIASMEIGDVLFGGWTAEYAGHREFGARGQDPDFFMRGAAQKWQSFVDKRTLELR